MTDDDRKAPADFLDQARRRTADPDYMRRAAEERDRRWESDRAIDRLERERAGHRTQLAGERAMAIEMAVWAAWERRRRADRACRHAIATPDNTKPRELIAVLATGHTVCHACAPRLRPKAEDVGRGLENDGRCDICETPTDRFTELTVALGPIVVYANACDDCMEFQRAALAETHHANGNGRRARWEDALDVLVHLHDQIRSGRLPVIDLEGRVFPIRDTFQIAAGSTYGQLLDLAYRQIHAAIEVAEPVFVSRDVFEAWRFAAGTFTPEPVRADELFSSVALTLLPTPVVLAERYRPCRALLWSHARADDGHPLINVAGFTQIDSRWMLAGWTTLPIEIAPDDKAAVNQEHAAAVDAAVGGESAVDLHDVWREMQSLWRLARQFVTVPERASRPGRRAAKRANLEQEHVTVIRLRRERHDAPETERDVDWSCRWMVRGHWRHLQDGRQTWVMPHVKGPEDKPFRVTDRVWEFVR